MVSVGVVGAAVVAAAQVAVGASGWSIVSSPSPVRGDNRLAGVSCVSASDCIAVGTVVEQWNGTKWSADPSVGGLSGVSCVSASDCTAVGGSFYDNSSGKGIDITVVQHWDGTAWSVVPSPSPGQSGSAKIYTYYGLDGVSCVSATACTAVGASGRNTLVEQWNGTAWSVVPSPSPPGGGLLTGISCASATACTAVGYAYGITHGETYPKAALAEQWNGATWSVTRSTGGGGVSGVSCVSATDCTAVGGGVEHWNGSTWSAVHTAGTGSLYGNGALYAVSCLSATDCTAAGFHYASRKQENIGYGSTLVEHWNGKKWSVMSSPSPKGSDSLEAVSCVSATVCTAVGWSYRRERARTLVEQEGG